MKNLDRSICSTCAYVSDCALTTDKTNISSCGEYVHQLENDDNPLSIVTFAMFSDRVQKNEQELLLN